MRNRILNLAILLPCLLLACALPALAGGAGNTLQLHATHSALMADGRHSTEINAYVRDANGRPVSGAVDVQFQTTAGTLSDAHVTTFGGVARVRLTSGTIAGVAHVSAFTSGGGSDYVDILFTDDPEATFEGNAYVAVSGASYLAYSATDRIIEAHGKNGGAKVTFRNIEISADRMQLRCDDSIVRAHDNITLKRGGQVVHASRLYYSMQSGQGYGIVEVDRRLQPVIISGDRLRVERSPTPIPSSYMLFPELQVKLVIVARGITYFPGDRLQFRHPQFYQDSQKLLSLPYYELPLNSEELFSDQFVSVGTSGFGLELPLYYNLSPTSTGIVYLRHQQQIGRGYYATDPGWSIDLVQGYSSQGGNRYEGSAGFTGLTRSDWGFRWTHSQEFNSASQGNFYIDFPHHSSVFGSGSYVQQGKIFRFGTDLSYGQTLRGPSGNSMQNDFYVETQPKKLTNNYLYSIGTTFSNERFHTSPVAGASTDLPSTISESTQNLTARAFSRPIPLDKRTTLTNSFTVGHLWTSAGTSGPVGLATLSLDHTFAGGGAMNLTYDMVYQPTTLDYIGGHHRLSMNYLLNANKKIQVSLFGSLFLDSPESSLLADMSYRLNSHWRILTSFTLQRFGSDTYNDIEFTLGRRLGAREIQLTYSTFFRRISVDFTATRF